MQRFYMFGQFADDCPPAAGAWAAGGCDVDEPEVDEPEVDELGVVADVELSAA